MPSSNYFDLLENRQNTTEIVVYLWHTKNQIGKKACEWKNDKISRNNADYSSDLAEANDRDILAFMSVGDVELYRNPDDYS